MGLFKKSEPKPEPQPQPQPQQPKSEIRNVYTTVTANLTDKMLRVELEEDHVYLDRISVKVMDDRIRITDRGIVIAEVTKRSKAYAELEPLVGKNVKDMAIDVKQGDYGEYYRVKLRSEITRITIG